MASRLEEEKKKATEKALAKNRKRAARKSAKEAEARKRQIVVNYDEDGNKIGDDGYPMTPARNRLHQTYNLVFIWMIVTFVAAAICIINSFFQNQTITDWELVWIGGNMFNGLPVANLFRFEALFLLYLCALSLFTNQKGTAWLYDGAPKKPVQVTFLLMLIPSVIYLALAVILVGLPEPASIISIILALCIYVFVPQVENERDSLKKAKVARTVVK